MPARFPLILALLFLFTSCEAQRADQTGFGFSEHLGVNAQFLWFQNCPQNPIHPAETLVDDQMKLLRGWA